MQDVIEMQQNVMSISRSRVKMLFENPRFVIFFLFKKMVDEIFITNLDLTFHDENEWILEQKFRFDFVITMKEQIFMKMQIWFFYEKYKSGFCMKNTDRVFMKIQIRFSFENTDLVLYEKYRSGFCMKNTD